MFYRLPRKQKFLLIKRDTKDGTGGGRERHSIRKSSRAVKDLRPGCLVKSQNRIFFVKHIKQVCKEIYCRW